MTEIALAYSKLILNEAVLLNPFCYPIRYGCHFILSGGFQASRYIIGLAGLWESKLRIGLLCESLGDSAMKRVLALCFMLVLLIIPVHAVDFTEASFTEDDVQVTIWITADTPWYSPFSEKVNISLQVAPLAENITTITITEIVVTVQRSDPDGLTYALVSAQSEEFSPAMSGTEYAEASASMILDGSLAGTDCYFAVVVEGTYSNSTVEVSFRVFSPENLIGPFVIAAGLASPQLIVGLAIMAAATLSIIAGLYAMKRSERGSSRKKLLEE
ncbi:MAG: hypothetical protein KAW94_00970 [Candidatus Thorarchaeota archaeon]|nr:hypothetical protein [Candidatus Thorarchaeota archaeon]